MNCYIQKIVFCALLLTLPVKAFCAEEAITPDKAIENLLALNINKLTDKNKDENKNELYQAFQIKKQQSCKQVIQAIYIHKKNQAERNQITEKVLQLFDYTEATKPELHDVTEDSVDNIDLNNQDDFTILCSLAPWSATVIKEIRNNKHNQNITQKDLEKQIDKATCEKETWILNSGHNNWYVNTITPQNSEEHKKNTKDKIQQAYLGKYLLELEVDANKKDQQKNEIVESFKALQRGTFAKTKDAPNDQATCKQIIQEVYRLSILDPSERNQITEKVLQLYDYTEETKPELYDITEGSVDNIDLNNQDDFTILCSLAPWSDTLIKEIRNNAHNQNITQKDLEKQIDKATCEKETWILNSGHYNWLVNTITPTKILEKKNKIKNALGLIPAPKNEEDNANDKTPFFTRQKAAIGVGVLGIAGYLTYRYLKTGSTAKTSSLPNTAIKQIMGVATTPKLASR